MVPALSKRAILFFDIDNCVSKSGHKLTIDADVS